MSMATINVSDGAPKITIGRLGVEVPDWIMERGIDAAATAYITSLRLDEIERRILALEAASADAPEGTIP